MQITHDRVEKASFVGQDWWLVHGVRTEDDGITTQDWCHTLPVATLEQRAAEYGIDHSDVETLLDVVLWEPYLQQLNDGVDHNHPMFLWNAPTVDEAREHYLKRIKKIKKMLAHPDQYDHNANLDTIRQAHNPDPELVALKTEHFTMQRDSIIRHKAQYAARLSTQDEKEMLRNKINRHKAAMRSTNADE